MANKKKVAVSKKTQDSDIAKELEEKIAKMEQDRNAKTDAAKKQLIDMLEVTAAKYLTATGVAEALRVLRFTHGENGPRVMLGDAAALARKMSGVAAHMMEVAEDLAPYEMDNLCNGFYTEDYATKAADVKYGSSNFELAYEMMCIDLCRNVGGAAEDMVGFCTRVDEEIESTKKALEEALAEKAE